MGCSVQCDLHGHSQARKGNPVRGDRELPASLMKYLTDMVGSVAKFTAESIDIESASNSLAWLRGNKNLIVRFQPKSSVLEVKVLILTPVPNRVRNFHILVSAVYGKKWCSAMVILTSCSTLLTPSGFVAVLQPKSSKTSNPFWRIP
jgi:hypothetical protein